MNEGDYVIAPCHLTGHGIIVDIIDTPAPMSTTLAVIQVWMSDSEKVWFTYPLIALEKA